MSMRALWLGASALGVVWCGQAAAQTAGSTPAGSAASDQSTTGDLSSSDRQATPAEQTAVAGTSEEVVVTATRRSENLMSSAVSASVLSGAQLNNKGVVTVDALQFAMPSVVVNNFGQGNNFNVRGIGKGEANTQTTTGVITYRDGVPSFPGYFQGEPFYDIDNIQVLRGPQGTIVGQNATGGAVFVNSNDPVIGGGVHGYVNANYGNYNDAGVQGAVNLPISDTLAARVALFGERRDSFYHTTGAGGGDYPFNKGKLREIAGRFSLLWKPIEGLSILSKTDLDYIDSGAYPASPYTNQFRTLPGTTTPNPNYRDPFDNTANAPQAARDKFLRTILRVEYRLDSGVRLRSVSGFSNGNTMYRADLDGTNSPAGTTNSTFFDSVTETQFSQEFNIISPDTGRFTWLVGAFGLWNTYFFPKPYQFVIDVAYPLNLPSAQYKLQGRNPERSLAAFGQVGFEITPSIKLDVGGRYTASRSINRIDVLQYTVPLRADQQTKSDNFSYKATLGWKASEDHYLYGFVATGFRPGGLNVPVSAAIVPTPFGPEKVTSYEVGWKGNLADRHVRTTLSGFYNSYKGFQVTIGYPTFPTFGIELNVPDTTKIYGFEAQTDITLGRLKLNAGVNVLHSSLGTFFATDPRGASVVACDPQTGPVSTSCLALGGRRQTYAPNFTFNIGAEYTFDLGREDKLTPRVNFGHVGNQWATLFENENRGDLLEPRNILNAQLALTHGSLTVTAYGTNLTNQHYPAALNSGLYFAGAPRQYGVKLLKTF
jgi:iron complex outermembrane receptor protein